MNKRRILLALGIPVLLLGAAVAPFAAAFVGITPLQERELLPGVHIVLDGYTSVALIEVGGGKLALVDAGNDPSGAPILAAIEARGAQAQDVVAVFLTHGHPDHVAACGLFPDATTWVGEAELPYLRGERAYHGPLPSLFGAQVAPCARLQGARDGQEIPVGERTFTARALTGHTAGSTAWQVGEALFVGDAATIKGDRLVGPPWVLSDDLDLARASLKALATRLDPPPAWVVPSHSGAARGEALSGWR